MVNHKMEALGALFSPPKGRGDGNGRAWGRRVEAISRFNSFKNRAD